MAAITHGMNIEQVKALAKKLDAKAQELDKVIAEVRGAIDGAAWEGPDAKTFKDKWNSEGVKQLKQAKQILTTAAAAANKNASSQESTSQAGTGSF